MLGAIERLGLLEDSLIILLTDHGGGGDNKYSHGSDHPMDKNVFWGCVAPGIEPGTEVSGLYIVDTAAVAAHALGLERPESWDAKLPSFLQ